MVREETIVEVFPNAAYSYLRTVVAVCEACITGEKRERLRLLPMIFSDRRFEAVCGGCGRRMVTVAKLRLSQRWPVACSDRCAQRIRREHTHTRSITRTCPCGKTFKPKRSDALFCSAACKQKAYRRRRGADLDWNDEAA
jgi:hypothetical protein